MHQKAYVLRVFLLGFLLVLYKSGNCLQRTVRVKQLFNILVACLSWKSSTQMWDWFSQC